MSSGADRPTPDRNPVEPATGPKPSPAERSPGARRPTPSQPAQPLAADDVAARRRGCLAMLLAGFLVLMAPAVLAFLSQGYLIPVVLIAAALFLYIFFHYVVWGGGWGTSSARKPAKMKKPGGRCNRPSGGRIDRYDSMNRANAARPNQERKSR